MLLSENISERALLVNFFTISTVPQGKEFLLEENLTDLTNVVEIR